eukprot:Skav210380  [mRNA]  locus=scaffold1526:173406:174981:+ [translate_table: standard]
MRVVMPLQRISCYQLTWQWSPAAPMARQSELFGKDYQQLRPKKINELVGLLNAGNVDLGQGSAPRGISAKVQCLWDLIEDQAAGLVLKKQETSQICKRGHD